jgi:hypothetical protein
MLRRKPVIQQGGLPRTSAGGCSLTGVPSEAETRRDRYGFLAIQPLLHFFGADADQVERFPAFVAHL